MNPFLGLHQSSLLHHTDTFYRVKAQWILKYFNIPINSVRFSVNHIPSSSSDQLVFSEHRGCICPAGLVKVGTSHILGVGMTDM